jgi:hypothetical protein
MIKTPKFNFDMVSCNGGRNRVDENNNIIHYNAKSYKPRNC